MNDARLLIVDDDPDVLLAAQMLLKQHYAIIHLEKNPANLATLLQNETYDLILLDMNFSEDVASGKEGFFWLREILRLDPAAVVIFITAFGDVEKAVRAIKEGAMDFVTKPWQNEKLLATVSAALKLSATRREVETLRERQASLQSDMDRPFSDIIGNSSAMQRVFTAIRKVAATDANILITGENGTGKELIARALHRQSLRSEKVFIKVDMGALSESLFESELFGHVKGAFTDARENRAGRFELADKGTLFLDEIANLPLPLQTKLLSALQNRRVIRVGASKEVDIDIRLICASNLPLGELVAENRFRQDLLYRINTVEIEIPPLRDRREDIALLGEYYVGHYARKYKRDIRQLSAAAITKLENYAWPGNVRELQHAAERAVIMSESKVLQAEDFLFSAAQEPENGLIFESYNLETIEKVVIQKTLQKYHGNISRAAQELGLTRAALYRRMEKYDIR